MQVNVAVDGASTDKMWFTIQGEAHEWVMERLQVSICLIAPVEAEEAKLIETIQQALEEEKIPEAVGALTFEVLRQYADGVWHSSHA